MARVMISNHMILSASCAPGAFMCSRDVSSGRCIYERWRCDGQRDCEDNEDELDCTCKLIVEYGLKCLRKADWSLVSWFFQRIFCLGAMVLFVA